MSPKGLAYLGNFGATLDGIHVPVCQSESFLSPKCGAYHQVCGAHHEVCGVHKRAAVTKTCSWGDSCGGNVLSSALESRFSNQGRWEISPPEVSLLVLHISCAVCPNISIFLYRGSLRDVLKNTSLIELRPRDHILYFCLIISLKVLLPIQLCVCLCIHAYV